jgi:hypothetical protein
MRGGMRQTRKRRFGEPTDQLREGRSSAPIAAVTESNWPMSPQAVTLTFGPPQLENDGR